MQNEKRIGKFYVSEDIIFGDKAEDIFVKMKFVPLRTEMLAIGMKFEYFGISPLFDEIELCFEAPEYEIIIDETEDGDISVSVKKMDY